MEDTSRNGSLNGLKVMVIDDSKTIRRTAETLLKKEGCDVVTAIDGFEALAKISDQQPNIIFVDIMMPRLDGYQTCALIKQPDIQVDPGDHAVFEGRPVRQGARADRRFGTVSDQAVHARGTARRDPPACRQPLMQRLVLKGDSWRTF